MSCENKRGNLLDIIINPVSPQCIEALNRYKKVLGDSKASNEEKAAAATNFGKALLDEKDLCLKVARAAGEDLNRGMGF